VDWYLILGTVALSVGSAVFGSFVTWLKNKRDAAREDKAAERNAEIENRRVDIDEMRELYATLRAEVVSLRDAHAECMESHRKTERELGVLLGSGAVVEKLTPVLGALGEKLDAVLKQLQRSAA
jgi:hypothetical protein